MKLHPSVDIQTQVRALLEVLDGDIAHLEQHLVTLETLREGIIKRDETGLTALLSELRQHQPLMQRHEARRQALRESLATQLGYNQANFTLSVLLTHLTGVLKTEVAQKRRILQDLTQRLQRHWQLTSALLQDCARLNRQLFRLIFAQSARTATYGPAGAMQQTQTQANMVNMHI